MNGNEGQPIKLSPSFNQTCKIALFGVIILSTIFALNQFKLSQYFPINNVQVYGANRLNHQEVQDLLIPIVKRGFFNVKVNYIRERLLQMPWVSDIFVRKHWPDQVEITVIEKKPMAYWNGESLLSEAGQLFTPEVDTYPQGLPRFVGPNGKQIFMLEYFNEINRLFAPLHVKISYLELTTFSTWRLMLDNGITLQIGHKDILTRLGHFVKVYPKIIGKRADYVDYIDLRYPNGVAIRWKGPIQA